MYDLSYRNMIRFLDFCSFYKKNKFKNRIMFLITTLGHDGFVTKMLATSAPPPRGGEERSSLEGKFFKMLHFFGLNMLTLQIGPF